MATTNYGVSVLSSWRSAYYNKILRSTLKNFEFFIYKLCFCQLAVKTLQLEDGRMIQAAKYGQDEEAAEAIELTEEEKVMEAKLRVMWKFYFV